MSLLQFKDAVDASVLDPAAKYAVFYCDGSMVNETAVRARCPKAELFAITVSGLVGKGIFCCDCETGDLSVAQAEQWVVSQLGVGAYRPTVYADASRWASEGLLSGLAKYGDRIRRWVASYPGTGANVPSGFDAHQYQTGDVDLNVALEDFFATAAPAPKPKSPHGIAHFGGSHNLATGAWTIHGLPGLLVHFAGPGKQASAEIQVQEGSDGGGEWRIRGLPFDAGPLGK